MKTTLREIINNIDKSENSKQETYVSWESLSREFNIDNLNWSDDKRLKAYFFKKWYCTDSYVGNRAYFLDGELVALSSQIGRKCSEDFTFISKETSDKLRNYLLSLTGEDAYILSYIEEEDFDIEIDDTFKIEYNSQILTKTALLDGEQVEILNTCYSYKEYPDKHFHTVEIKKENGEVLEIDCRELDFEYNK